MGKPACRDIFWVPSWDPRTHSGLRFQLNPSLNFLYAVGVLTSTTDFLIPLAPQPTPSCLLRPRPPLCLALPWNGYFGSSSSVVSKSPQVSAAEAMVATPFCLVVVTPYCSSIKG